MENDVKDLSQILIKYQKLNPLNLYSNYIGDDGARHIGNFLQNNHFLEKIILAQYNITDSGLKSICEGLKSTRDSKL